MRRWLYGVIGLAIGCAGGTETGNPSFEGQLAYDAYSSDVSVALVRGEAPGDPPSGALLVDAVWLVLGDVTFAPEGACDRPDPSAAHATGIGEGDHAAQGRVVTAVELPEGAYCGVRLALERAPAEPVAGPAELAERSILIQGALPDGRAFRVLSRMQGAIELASATPFAMDPSAGPVLLGFDVAVWLGAIDWSAAEGDGAQVVVDEARNAALLGAFEAAIARGTGLYRADATAPITAAQPLAQGN